MLALSTVELRLLLRGRITVASVVAVPLVLAALTLFGRRPAAAEEWAGLLARHFLLLMTLSVYLVSLTVFTARRQSLVLKRLRTSGLTDREILVGVLGPVMLVGLAQTVAYVVFCLAIDAPAPTSPLLVGAGVVLGVVAAMALGVATACLSRSVEATQLTSTPVVFASMAGLVLAGTGSPVLAPVGLALPLAGPTDLVAKGWADAGAVVADLPVTPLALASTVLWLSIAGVAVNRWFRWEPRR